MSYSIAKDSKKKSRAFTLLAYLTGKEGHGRLDEERRLPAVAEGRRDARRPPGVPQGGTLVPGVAVRARLQQRDQHRQQRAAVRLRRQADGLEALQNTQEAATAALRRGR